jgi:hypothetical protein
LDRLHHPARLFDCGMQSVNHPPNRICRAFSPSNPLRGCFWNGNSGDQVKFANSDSRFPDDCRSSQAGSGVGRISL